MTSKQPVKLRHPNSKTLTQYVVADVHCGVSLRAACAVCGVRRDTGNRWLETLLWAVLRGKGRVTIFYGPAQL